MDASVSVISRMAKTIDTTVMIDAAIPARMICATCGSACEGKIALGAQSFSQGISWSSHDRRAPEQPNPRTIISGRTRKPPRRLYRLARQ